MKNFPFKPKHSAITSAIGQAPLISAAQVAEAKHFSVATPPSARAKATKTINSSDFDSLPDSGFVRLPSLLLLFACSRASIWRWAKTKKIPAPIKLGPRVTAWNVGQLRRALSACMNEVDQ